MVTSERASSYQFCRSQRIIPNYPWMTHLKPLNGLTVYCFKPFCVHTTEKEAFHWVESFPIVLKWPLFSPPPPLRYAQVGYFFSSHSFPLWTKKCFLNIESSALECSVMQACHPIEAAASLCQICPPLLALSHSVQVCYYCRRLEKVRKQDWEVTEMQRENTKPLPTWFSQILVDSSVLFELCKRIKSKSVAHRM